VANKKTMMEERRAHQDLAQRQEHEEIFSFDTEQIDGVARGGAREEDKDMEAAANVQYEDMYCDRDYDSDYKVWDKDPRDERAVAEIKDFPAYMHRMADEIYMIKTPKQIREDTGLK
jgi:hypothetical protein